MRKAKKTRTYDATGRRRAASAGQERALAAAARLFAERGYRETTMEAIASDAEIATPTLYAAFGSKRGVLSKLLDRLVSGMPGGPSVLATAEARELLAEEDPVRALALFAEHMSQVLERVSPVYEAMKSAAKSEPDVAELYARALGSRFRNIEAVAARLDELGALRAGIDVEDAARTIWSVSSPEVRHLLVVHARWSRARHAEWLGRTLANALVADVARRRK